MKPSVVILIVLILIFPLYGKSQDCYPKPSGDRSIAAQHFSYEFYQCALREYIIILASKPKSKKFNRRVAQCYLRSPGANKYLAVPYLEKLVKLGKTADEVFLELAKAYFYGGKFELSSAMFDKYIALAKPIAEDLIEVETFKKNIEFSKEIIKHPVNVSFKNLGKDVNSEYNDLHPFVTDKEDFIMFTTDRKGCRGDTPDMDGFFSDIAISKVKRGRDRFSSSRSVSGSFNSENIERVAGGSPNGDYFIYASDDQMNMQLKISYKAPGRRSYPAPEYISSINKRNFSELAATITNDGSLLIFSSDMNGGYGGMDLWMSKRLPNSEWGTPINMGPTINTPLDENFPNFSQDQDFITFCSKGHPGMGGYDIFKTEFSEELKIWSKAKNLGYPINTCNDDFTITFVKNGRYGYKSDIRKDTYGLRDLYKLTFHDAIPSYTVIKSSVQADTLSDAKIKLNTYKEEAKHLQQVLDSLKRTSADTGILDSVNNKYHTKLNQLEAINPFTNSIVEVTTDGGALYGKYTPNTRNGKFIMILEPGVYTITITNNGFEPIKNRIKILDKMNYKTQFSKHFYLKPKAN